MALAPDINGVWSVVETFETTSKPMKIDRTKTVSNPIPFIRRSPRPRAPRGPSRHA